jgi:hypothetical protein
MTSEERLDRLEHVVAGIAEERRQDSAGECMPGPEVALTAFAATVVAFGK